MSILYSCPGVKAALHPGQVSRSSQRQTTTHAQRQFNVGHYPNVHVFILAFLLIDMFTDFCCLLWSKQLCWLERKFILRQVSPWCIARNFPMWSFLYWYYIDFCPSIERSMSSKKGGSLTAHQWVMEKHQRSSMSNKAARWNQYWFVAGRGANFIGS